MSAGVFRWLKRVTFVGVGLLIVLSIYGAYLYGQIRDTAGRDEAHKSDAIVVLGAAQYNGRPSPVLKARLDHAYELYAQQYAHAIITTGGYGPDPNFSEAHVGAKYLAERGVDAANIVTEQGSRNTYDSILAASRLMQAKGWKSALVVSDGFHLFRLKRMFEDNGIVAYTSPARNSPIELAASQRFWHSVREVLLYSAYRWLNI